MEDNGKELDMEEMLKKAFEGNPFESGEKPIEEPENGEADMHKMVKGVIESLNRDSVTHYAKLGVDYEKKIIENLKTVMEKTDVTDMRSITSAATEVKNAAEKLATIKVIKDLCTAANMHVMIGGEPDSPEKTFENFIEGGTASKMLKGLFSSLFGRKVEEE